MSISVLPVEGIDEINAGDRLGRLLAESWADVKDGDVVVVASKAVAKAEGRVIPISSAPDGWERLVDIESRRVLRRRGDLVISETAHGFVCANAGIDRSNVAAGYAVLLPLDPDRSARTLRDESRFFSGVDIGVIVSDTNGRVWRRGATDVALGCAGLTPINDLKGQTDRNGNVLKSTEICAVDEMAAAASLVMGKADGIPMAIIRGLGSRVFGSGSVAKDVLRPYSEDMFR